MFSLKITFLPYLLALAKLYPLSFQSINSLSRTYVSKFPCDDEFVFVLIKLMINFVGRHNSSELHQFSVNV